MKGRLCRTGPSCRGRSLSWPSQRCATLSRCNVCTVVGTVIVAGLLCESSAFVAPQTPLQLFSIRRNGSSPGTRADPHLFFRFSLAIVRSIGNPRTLSLAPMAAASEATREHGLLCADTTLLLLPFQAVVQELIASLLRLVVSARGLQLGVIVGSDPLTHTLGGQVTQ